AGKGPADRLGALQHQQPAKGLNRTSPQLGQRRELSKAIVQDYARRQVAHRQSISLARSRLPLRPLPREPGFTAGPPAGGTRVVPTEMVFRVGPNIAPQALDAAMRRLGLSTLDSQTSSLAGGTVLHLRIADGRQMAEAVRALEAENIGVAQPNYV